MAVYIVIPIIVSTLICLFIIYKKQWFISDHLHTGPQKFHTNPTPRVGGIGIFAGYLAGLIFLYLKNPEILAEFFPIILGSAVIFFSGLFEDIKRSLGAKLRLLLMFLGASIAVIPGEVFVSKLDLPVDFLFRLEIVAFAFTVFALIGITNAINIIDGFNGLASMVSVIIFAGIAYVAYQVHDYTILTITLIMIGSLIGFFILNYPNGFIFMGDGGAYFTGFIMGISLVLLVIKHQEVSPWFALTLIIYPVFEVVFSIYRRISIKKVSPFLPDGLHLHSIIYKRLTRKLFKDDSHKLNRNASTSPFLWVLSSVGVVPAIFCWNNTPCLMIFSLMFVLIYTFLYWKILLGRIPTNDFLRGKMK